MTKHVVRDLDSDRQRAYSRFYYSPYLTANVAVTNWRFLSKMGISGANWFEGFGRCVEVRKMAKFGVDSPVVGPDLPTVLTLSSSISPSLDFQPPSREAKDGPNSAFDVLLGLRTADPLADDRHVRSVRLRREARYRRNRVLNRFRACFSSTLNRDSFFGSNGEAAPRDVLRVAPFGRIAFSHSGRLRVRWIIAMPLSSPIVRLGSCWIRCSFKVSSARAELPHE